jgi:hypothetical protein
MRVFAAHFMRDTAAPIEDETPHSEAVAPSEESRARYAALADVLCDEELLEPGERK